MGILIGAGGAGRAIGLALATSSPEEQKKIAEAVQQEAYDQVIYIPLGQYRGAAAWRKSLSGVLDGAATPVFWNIDKSE